MASLFIIVKKKQSLTQNKHHKYLRLLLGVFFLFFLSTFFSSPTLAATITKDQVKKMGSFKAERYGIQGGTITEKYFIYADSNSHGYTNGTTTIKFYDRKTKKEAKADSSLINRDFKHASSIHYDWGSGYAQVADASSGNWWCFSTTSRKIVSDDKCGSFLRSGGLDNGSDEHWRQGWTKYGDHYFRGYGNDVGLGINIEVYDKNRDFIESYTVNGDAMPACEIEDVAVDGAEGTMYVLCDGKSNGHAAEYYKIDKSVFSKYITPKGGSSNPSGSSDSVNIFGSKPYNPEDDNLTIIDDTYSTDPPVSTYDGTVDTNFFGTVKDEEGCGVYTTLSFTINILSIGIVIAASIGITLSGITYLTAKGDVARTTKAKRRIYEIVIGLIAYAVFYSLLTFLTPEFNPELKVCNALTEEEKAQIKAETEAKKQAIKDAQEQDAINRVSKGDYDPSKINYSSIQGVDIAGASTIGKRMLQAAEETAQYMAKNKFIYFQYDCSNGFCNPYMRSGYGPYEGESLTWARAKKVRYSHCSSFATLVEKKAKLLPDTHSYHSYIDKGKMRFKNDASESKLLKNFKIIHGNGMSVANLVKRKKLAPGDVFGSPGRTHTMIFAGKVNGKYWIYEVNAGNNTILKYKGGLHKTISGSESVGDILHAK